MSVFTTNTHTVLDSPPQLRRQRKGYTVAHQSSSSVELAPSDRTVSTFSRAQRVSTMLKRNYSYSTCKDLRVLPDHYDCISQKFGLFEVNRSYHHPRPQFVGGWAFQRDREDYDDTHQNRLRYHFLEWYAASRPWYPCFRGETGRSAAPDGQGRRG